MTILVAAAALVVVLWFVSRPILGGRQPATPLAPPVGNWELNALLQQLLEIDLDLQAGRISAGDHDRLKRFYQARVASALATSGGETGVAATPEPVQAPRT
ncbi:MAG: hypothetical protein HYY13_04050 [Nitrospirae bacterium]|nr:hypothetical protein [Nitrospirota bacterium]